MKIPHLLIFFSLASSRIFASVDDTLPSGIASRFLVFPFVIRSPETKWGFGCAAAFFFKAGKDKAELRTSDINLVSLYTLQKQKVAVLGSTVFFPGEKAIFRFQGSYSYYPDKFWGLGNDSPEDLLDNYSINQTFFNPQLIVKVFRKFFTGISLEWQRITDFSYTSGGVFDSQQIPGRSGGITAGAGALFTYDSRNNAFSPTHGSFFEINVTGFEKSLGSDFNFITYSLDLRKFFFLRRSTVLALQTLARFNDGNTPIRNLSMLGGTEMMRGYYKGRYMDKDLFALQSEVRQYLFWRLGLAAFVSAGEVASTFNDWSLAGLHFAYGAGIRILMNEKEKLNLRVDLGFGKRSQGVYVILKEAF